MAVRRYGDLDLGAARSLGRRGDLMGCLLLRRGVSGEMRSDAGLLIEEEQSI
jgi:hypothetical protein